ncbi:hypothetical protein ASE63_21095 [Bosea sp. Root381]|uniref:hypothetical protein n=1 Tax=Bosea sp. Root381 TaxID=1736524 RepID=UPI0007151119|nr:hypothetical protein [Bosea sp. Root381]KRE09493.1 hypothetical protein ASE63_21095 [Bosea sp. Root381]
MTIKKRAALALMALLSSPLVGSAQAEEFTRMDVLALINRDVRNWTLNADEMRLDIETVRIPRASGEQGKVCGPIVSLRRTTDPRAPSSYAATLWIEKGQLVIGGMSPFFMNSEELVTTDLCR